MTPEMYTIIGIGIALAGLMLNGQRLLRGETAALRQEMNRKIAALREEMHDEIAQLRQETRGEFAELRGEITELRREIAGLRERMARVEGLLDGLGEADGSRSVG